MNVLNGNQISLFTGNNLFLLEMKARNLFMDYILVIEKISPSCLKKWHD